MLMFVRSLPALMLFLMLTNTISLCDLLCPFFITEVLKMSSRIGTKIFMPFLESDVKGNKFTTLGGTEFEDPDGTLELSASQRRHFYKWARPAEIAQRQRKVSVSEKQN